MNKIVPMYIIAIDNKHIAQTNTPFFYVTISTHKLLLLFFSSLFNKSMMYDGLLVFIAISLVSH